MAKGKVKKGFGSYLLILFLAVVATFLVLVTVMIFSPFKNILGFKYFAFNEDKIVLTETGGKEDETFDFSSIKNININCSFATVSVERYYKVDTYAFRFENTISGFARDGQDTDFKYEVFYDDDNKKNINVEVHEPEGFLYFNKNIKISVLIPTSKTYTLENTSINITNTSGNIYVGNNVKAVSIPEENYRNFITIGSLDVKTNSGDVLIRSYTNSTINNFFYKSEKGNFDTDVDLTINGNCNIYSQKGEINFKNLTVKGASIFDLGNSEFYSPNLQSDLSLNIKNGYLDIDNFKGIISSNDAIDQMNNASITIKEFDGTLSLPFVNDSKINLGKVSADSEIYIQSKKGNITINELKANIAKIETTSGEVNVNTFGNDIDVTTTSGNINITYQSETISNQIDLVSNSGNITLKVKPTLAFLLKIYDTKGEYRKDNGIDIEWLDELIENPYKVLGGDKVVSVTTDGNLNILSV